MDDILRDFPGTLETERLTIRCPQPGDGPELNAAVIESWDDLRPWMPWAVQVPTVEQSEALLRRAQVRFLAREELWLLLFLRGTHTLVGSSGLHRIDWSVPRVEIGYWARRRYARQGYITEAAVGIAGFAFEVLGARRVEIRCDARNERSAAVARRAGFALEATIRHASRDHLAGDLRDELIFAQIR